MKTGNSYRKNLELLLNVKKTLEATKGTVEIVCVSNEHKENLKAFTKLVGLDNSRINYIVINNWI